MHSFRRIKRSAEVGLLCATAMSFAAVAEQTYEQPTTVNAASILPSNIVAGPNHTVRNEVHNDGFLNIYTIDSKYGSLRAVSTDTLYKRIGELNAMAGMENLRGTEEFKQGLTEKAGDFVEGGARLLRFASEVDDAVT